MLIRIPRVTKATVRTGTSSRIGVRATVAAVAAGEIRVPMVLGSTTSTMAATRNKTLSTLDLGAGFPGTFTCSICELFLSSSCFICRVISVIVSFFFFYQVKNCHFVF